MIKISLLSVEGFYDVHVSGHSKDSLICASVSVLLETWRLAEMSLEKQQIIYKDGLIEARVAKTNISEILFIQLCIGLTAIQKKYPEDISLNIGG